MTTKQESLLGEKEKAVDALKQEVGTLRHSLSLEQEKVRVQSTVVTNQLCSIFS